MLCIGAVLTCVGYALSRSATDGATGVFFLGEAIVALGPLYLVLRKEATTDADGMWVALALGAASFLILACYSPLRFAFVDEYQHALTAQSIMTTGHLFGHNPALPVSATYPGLEIVTSALSQLSGLSIFASGTLIAGLCHVTMTVLVYCLARQLRLSPRLALFSVVIFSCGYTYQSFLSFFAYETFAVPFLLASVIALLRFFQATSTERQRVLGLAALVFALVTIVSHHITSYVCVLYSLLIFGSFGLSDPVWKKRRKGLLVAGLLLVGIVLGWNFGVATDTVHYLGQIRVFLFNIVSKTKITPPTAAVIHHVAGTGPAPGASTPLPLTLLGEIGAVAVLILIPFGAWTVWQDPERFPRSLWATPLLACIGYFATVPIFLSSAGGASLVGRGQILLLIFAGPVAAIPLGETGRVHSVVQYFRERSSRRVLSFGVVTTLAIAMVLGATSASYPPYPSKLPGPYNVDAVTRSTDQRTLEAGSWIGTHLGVKTTVAADSTEESLLSSVAGVPVLPNVVNLFETEGYTPADASLVQALKLQYIFADSRLTEEVPADGADFPRDPLDGHYVHPLPVESLAKFDHIPGVSRVFDDGVIVMYGVKGSEYYRKAP